MISVLCGIFEILIIAGGKQAKNKQASSKKFEKNYYFVRLTLQPLSQLIINKQTESKSIAANFRTTLYIDDECDKNIIITLIPHVIKTCCCVVQQHSSH